MKSTKQSERFYRELIECDRLVRQHRVLINGGYVPPCDFPSPDRPSIFELINETPVGLR